jgi:hypothetical protein
MRASVHAWLRAHALSHTERRTRTRTRTHARTHAHTHTHTHTRVRSHAHVGLIRLVEWLPWKEGITCLDLNSSDVISPETIKKLLSRSKFYSLNPEP